MEYTFDRYVHRFAIWAAARSVQKSAVGTERIAIAIEKSELPSLTGQADFASQQAFDEWHKSSCRVITKNLKKQGIEGVTYGRAARIVSTYIKAAGIVRMGEKSNLAGYAHPVLDARLLANLKKKFPEIKSIKGKWTQLDEQSYDALIAKLLELDVKPLWKLEYFSRSK
jgi:hypothetical protein